MSIVVDAVTALRARLERGATGVISVTMTQRLTTSMLLGMSRSFADHAPRTVFIDAGSESPAATIGVGVAATVDIVASATDAQHAVRQLLSQDARRVVLLAVPFAPSAATSSRAVCVPRLWLRQRAGEAMPELAVDVGDGHVDAALSLLQALLEAPAPRVAHARRPFARVDAPDQRGHADAVAEALAAIDRGDVSKVVLARRSTIATGPVRGVHLDDLLAGLLRRERRGTAYLVVNDGDGDGDAFFGCSPERLCIRRHRRLDVDALAGTAARGADDDDDDVLAERLRSDGKERREHAAVVDAVVGAVRPLSSTIDVPGAPDVVRLGRVQHLHTPISAQLLDDAPVFAALHPTPAVAGTPRDAATALIARLEPFARGLYAGFVGVADADGEHLTVALRCGHAHDDVVDVYAGSGLVEGAVAEREWLELERKAGLVLDVLHDQLGEPAHG